MNSEPLKFLTKPLLRFYRCNKFRTPRYVLVNLECITLESWRDESGRQFWDFWHKSDSEQHWLGHFNSKKEALEFCEGKDALELYNAVRAAEPNG